MSKPSDSDLDKIADALVRCATAIRERGAEALKLTRDWQSPLSSGGGPGPKNGVSDPTGNAATNLLERYSGPQFEHAALNLNLNAVHTAALNLHHQLLIVTKNGSRRVVDPAEIPEGACRSCWRDNRHFEPVYAGVYKDGCRWCSEFLAEYAQLPPRALLVLHHQGRRISQAMVEKAVGKRIAG